MVSASSKGTSRNSLPIRLYSPSFVVEKQITAADSVLVLVDAIQAAHEHEPGTARRAEPCFQRLPVWFHRQPAHCCGDWGSDVRVAATSRYIRLSSSFSEISSRSSAAVG